MIHTINIDPENTLLLQLMKTQYDMEARKELLGFLIAANNSHTEAFQDYEKTYIELYTQYSQLKAELERTIINPYCEEHGLINSYWNLDFNTHTITIQ